MSIKPTIKEEMIRIAERLSETATWEDVAYEIYVHEKLERGLRDLDEGREFSTEDARIRVGLQP